MYFDNHAESQWLRFHASTAGDTGSIPGWEDPACHMVWPKQQQQQQNFNKN